MENHKISDRVLLRGFLPTLILVVLLITIHETVIKWASLSWFFIFLGIAVLLASFFIWLYGKKLEIENSKE